MEIKTEVAKIELTKMAEHTHDFYKHSALLKAIDAIELMENLTFCPECKYYYAPVCTFYPQLPMTSRHGFCYHAIKGEYQGDAPTIERRKENDKS